MYNLPIVKNILTSRGLIYTLLVLIGTIILFKPPIDPDFGWHYKYGEYIFQNNSVLKDNVFSYTNTNYQWANSYWLSQYLVYTSHHILGHIFSTLLLSLLISFAILNILNRHSKDTTTNSVLFLLLVSVISIFAVTVRPLYYSTLFMFILIDVLLRKRSRNKFLPLMFLLWANTHADFVIGLFILGSYSLFNFMENTGFPKTKVKSIFPPWKNKKNVFKYLVEVRSYFLKILKDKKTVTNIKRSFSILTFSFLITFINPYGTKLWATLLKELTQPVKSFVAEWAPMGEIGLPYFAIGVFLAMGLLAGVTSNKTACDKYKPWYVFLIFFFYPLSLNSSYFIRIFIIISSFSILDRLILIKMDIEKVIVKDAKKTLRYMLSPFLMFLLFSITPTFLKSVESASDIKLWSDIKKYPYKAVAYIKENKLEGNMMNEYSWGGYLIWQLPEHKTFIDGRMAAWRINDTYLMEDHRKIYFKTEENEELLKNYLETYDIKWILHRPNSPIVKYLGEKNGDVWETIYEDDTSVIIMRK